MKLTRVIGGVLMAVILGMLIATACSRATPTPTSKPATPAVTPTPRATPTAIPTPTLAAAAVATTKPWPAGVYRTYEEAVKDWPRVVAAAKQEGTMTLYAFSIPAAGTAGAALNDAFSTKYGIKVEILAGQTAEAGARLKAEASTGKYTVDVRTAGSGSRGQFGPLDLNLGEPFVPPAALEPNVPWTVDPLMDRPYEGNSTVYTWNPMYILLNVNLVPPEREPKKWSDLADPWFKGKLVMQDLRVPGPQADFLVPAYKQPDYGEKFIRSLVANTGKMYTTFSEAAASVVQGQYAASPGVVAPSQMTQYTKLAKPWSWKMIEPEDGVAGFTSIAWVIKNAPHPNAAKLYSDFMLSKEADDIRAKFWGAGLSRRDTVPVDPIIFSKKTFPGSPMSMETTWLEALKITEKGFDPIMKEFGF